MEMEPSNDVADGEICVSSEKTTEPKNGKTKTLANVEASTKLKNVETGDKLVNGKTESCPSPPDITTDAFTETLSVCLVCGKKDRSVEFILPDHYCSQSCADKHGKFGKKGSKNFIHRLPPKGKKNGKRTRLNASNGIKEMALAGYPTTIAELPTFNWQKFLAEEKLIAAPDNLFHQEPLSPTNNEFKVGMQLEGIDPYHPSRYCVLSIAKVIGFRIRLHFDGYLECYDFWTNANSDEIFPVGWCKEMGKQLQAPKGTQNDKFCWESYLNTSNAAAAPRSLFSVCTNQFVSKKPAFEVGDKLEAVDIKNKNTYICVASVADTYGDKLLVHFDGWEDNYDYWCYYNSAHIHHVGWCQENLKTLSAPNGYTDPSSFTWDSYLKETNSKAASFEAFAPVLEHEFQVKMALEAVDKRNPSLIRVAQVVKITETGLLIHFCGWDSKYDYWEEADSPNLHPIGWCEKSGHPLQPPLTTLDMINYLGGCPTVGCYGIGHVKGAMFASHYRLAGCPYADIYLNKNAIIPDRLTRKPAATSQSVSPLEMNNNQEGIDINQTSTCSKRRGRSSSMKGGKTKRCRKESKETDKSADNKPQVVDVPAHPRSSPSTSLMSSSASGLSPTSSVPPQPLPTKRANAELHNFVYQSVFHPAVNVKKKTTLPYSWERHVHTLPAITGLTHMHVPEWTYEQVADLMKTVAPEVTEEQKQHVIDQKIDGQAFLLLSQQDLTSRLDLKLGPALKIYNAMLYIRKALG